ncbi:ATP-binding cassette sub-family C member 5 [Nematostella vectensis]|uniref:ATP-binding cassette sub-family C member 5 n=1 Tax=Nematostella vectensis TaxID=45351 RepID=UPI0013901627|nr:ATP-binding cassette sub-family C member 5 [Nematostella vectensis]
MALGNGHLGQDGNEKSNIEEDTVTGITNAAFDDVQHRDQGPKENASSPAGSNKKMKKGKSKYNWKQFLPFAPRNPDVPQIDDSGFMSMMFMSWASPIVYKGFRKPLQMDDLGELSQYETIEVNGTRIKRIWDEEVDTVGLKHARLGKVLWRCVRTRLIMGMIMFVISQMITFLGPALFIRYILEYLAKQNTTSLGYGIALVMGLLLTEILRVAFLSFSFFLNIRTGTRARSMVYSLIYQKLSKLRNVGDKSIGEFVNLCASDAQRIYEGVSFCNFLIGGPVVIIMAIIYTTYLIGPSALVGCGLVLLVFPIQMKVARLAGQLRGKVVRITDQRVRMMSEVLNCIKLIKMYAWDRSFADNIVAKRTEERNALTSAGLLQGINMSIALIIPTVATVASFSVHIATGQNLTSAQAFTIMTIFNVLVFSLAVLPFGVRAVAEASTALTRVKSLMQMEELSPFLDKPSNSNVALSIEHCDFSWDKVESEQDKKNKAAENGAIVAEENGNVQPETKVEANSKTKPMGKGPPGGRRCPPGRGGPILPVKTKLVPSLFDIDLEVKKGSLIGICGSVGSGKSSLLQCILSQMRKTKGRVGIGGSIAYVSQQAWIMNATAKDNILLGLPFNESRYKAACFACSLTKDFEILPNGDQTEIGERGINLSGGQKQRISLARALYADKDLYLLDDPLSAVDAHVGQHIFKHCIKGSLWGKSVLFATHQLQYLSQCDQVLYMNNGRIAERGTYIQLIQDKKEFSTLIRQFLQEVEEELEDEARRAESELYGDSSESRARSETNLSSCSADEIQQLFERQLTISKSTRSKTSGIDTGSPRASFRSESLEPFKRQASKSESHKSRHSAGEGMPMKAPPEDTDVPKSREEAGKLTEVEERQEGAVRLSTYVNYMKSAGGVCISFMLVLFMLACLLLQTFVDSWLGYWLDAGNKTGIIEHEDGDINNYYMMVYGVCALVFLFGLLLKTFMFVKFTLKASSKLHDLCFKKVMSGTMSFFDVTPTGRILNRFSKDLDEVDAQLPWTLESFMQNVLRIFIALGLVSAMFPYFLIAVVPLMIFFFVLNSYFRRSVRELKRLDGITRSPIFSHLTATVQGLSTLHAFDKMADFNARFSSLIDLNTLPFFMYFVSNRWLSVRLDIITVVITTVTALLVVTTKGVLTEAFAGLALSYAIRITGLFQFTVRMAAETESRFTSVERINYYITSVPSEAPAEIPETKTKDEWPQEGTIVFNQVKMRYRSGLPLVLDNLTGFVRPQEKIGIVGRTGSGKSSVGVVLWRLVELSGGSIKIDNIDISTLGLQDLRSKISIIPQDPVLFAGTIRFNLDPFRKYSDEELWKALERSHLKDMVSNLPLKLEAPVVENGENFSVGERQLICMARALLRHSKILMMDEATAAIDSETDAKIQDTIRDAFVDCTVLTIAHRLNTVLTADRIMVMEAGKIVEFDEPSVLSADPESYFSKLLQAADLQKTEEAQGKKPRRDIAIDDVTLSEMKRAASLTPGKPAVDKIPPVAVYSNDGFEDDTAEQITQL